MSALDDAGRDAGNVAGPNETCKQDRMADATLEQDGRTYSPESYLLLVDDRADAETLNRLSGVEARVYDDILPADEAELLDLVEARNVFGIVPGNASPALLQRARDAAQRVRPHAKEVRIVVWEAWPVGSALGPPSGIGTPGAILSWLMLLPEMCDVSIEGNGRARPNPPIFDGPPRPLTVELLPVPCLEPKMLPEAQRGWIIDGAERMGAPPDYAAAAALVALSAVAGRKVCIRPAAKNDWLVCPNLWGAAIGPPSVLKTPAIQEALRPLFRLALEAQKEHGDALEKFEHGLLVAKAKSDNAKVVLKKAVKSSSSDDELLRLAQEAAYGETLKPPPCRRYLTNDSTVEKLGELMAENPNGLLQFRDELIGLLRMMGRQGHENDRGFYLEAWDGLGSYQYDRIGRGSIFIPTICLAMFGGIQPGPLARYLRASASGEWADGFFPRFQLMVYPDIPATWKNVDRWPDTKAKNRAFAVFNAFASMDPKQVGATHNDDRDVSFLGFSSEGQEFFNAWRTDRENRLLSGRDNQMITGHLSKYRKLMPALSLLFHLIEVVDSGAKVGAIDLRAAEAAAAWCEFLESHARRIYQSALDGDPETAAQLGERLKAGLSNPFRVRDVVRKGWAGLDTTADVEQALLILEDRRWVKPVEVPSTAFGGRPTVDYWINPALRQGDTSIPGGDTR